MTDLARVAEALGRARRISALTGAGVSAASGIPTFRGADGLWKKVRAETLATPEAFENDPRLVWEWYDWRRQMVATARPNPAHDVLAKWTHERPGFTLITQNVDGLHEKRRCRTARAAARLHLARSLLPALRGGPARLARRYRADANPATTLPSLRGHRQARSRLVRRRARSGRRRESDRRDRLRVFLTIGTSAVVYPAAGLVHQAKRRGAFTVEINLDATEASPVVDVSLRGQAAEILTRLDTAIRSIAN